MVSEKKIFEYFLENLPFMLPRQPIKLSKLDKIVRNMEDYSINISVKKNSNIPNDSAEIVNFHFSHYKSMGTLSCHSNQSSFPTGIKKHKFLSPIPVDAMCVIWKKSASWLQMRCSLKMLTDAGRTPDACLYFKLTYVGSGEQIRNVHFFDAVKCISF